jgi:hypothetical protein
MQAKIACWPCRAGEALWPWVRGVTLPRLQAKLFAMGAGHAIYPYNLSDPLNKDFGRIDAARK